MFLLRAALDYKATAPQGNRSVWPPLVLIELTVSLQQENFRRRYESLAISSYSIHLGMLC
jgi:hypothetical protein